MRARSKSVVCIVTPGTPAANNGNWRTAVRWKSLLDGWCKVILQSDWSGEPADALLALHATRSAQAIQAWSQAGRKASLAVVLTGTDLYRDLAAGNAATAASLDAAARLVALQDEARAMLRPAWRRKCTVIFQSAKALAAAVPRGDLLRVVVVGHLRAEKDPRTVFALFEHLPAEFPLVLRQVGAPLDASLAREARALMRHEPRYRYSGILSHGLARDAIRRADVLLHPSVMEGGANVIVEAITAGTAVLASRVPGNVGMLGARFPGYFPAGDASTAAGLLVRMQGSPTFRARLRQACEARLPLFTPAREREAVRALVSGLLGSEA